MTKQISNHAAAAKQIRKHLKANGVAARVRSSTASMMTAVDVDLVDTTPAARREIEAYVSQFEYGHFDGMTDCFHMSNVRDDIPQVKYAHVNVRYSDELQAAAAEFCESYWADWDSLCEMDRNDRIYRTLRNDQPHTEGYRFWLARKPRVRAA